MIEKILSSPQQFQYPLEACDFVFGSLKACSGSPDYKFLEEKMKAKFKQPLVNKECSKATETN